MKIRKNKSAFLFNVAARISARFRMHIMRDRFLLALSRWHKEDGDKMLRFSYDGLDSESVVWDIGGFYGDWSARMNKRYGCHIHIFEPIPDCVRSMEARFAENSKITIHPYALSDATGSCIFYDQGQGSSAFRTGGSEVICNKKSVTDVLTEIDYEIDLLKINVEGGEYEVLPALIHDGIERIKYLTIQFHNFIPDAERRRREIREALAQTHEEVWCYHFVWETWKRR